MKNIGLIMLLFWSQLGRSQDTLFQLDLESFVVQVKENHPLSFIANNYILQADQFIVNSKGAFDPQALAQINQKYFDGKTPTLINRIGEITR